MWQGLQLVDVKAPMCFLPVPEKISKSYIKNISLQVWCSFAGGSASHQFLAFSRTHLSSGWHNRMIDLVIIADKIGKTVWAILSKFMGGKIF